MFDINDSTWNQNEWDGATALVQTSETPLVEVSSEQKNVVSAKVEKKPAVVQCKKNRNKKRHCFCLTLIGLSLMFAVMWFVITLCLMNNCINNK
jgi:t-SNARE complex subunit (syntaxin)